MIKVIETAKLRVIAQDGRRGFDPAKSMWGVV